MVHLLNFLWCGLFLARELQPLPKRDTRNSKPTFGVFLHHPDGFIDDSSIHKITIRLNADNALELVQTANHLGYEIRPASNLD